MGSWRSAAVIGVLCAAGVALGDVVYRYDEAGNLISASNPETDAEACGIPPVVCPGDPHGVPACLGRICGLQCDEGWTVSGAQCVDPTSDVTACGAELIICPDPEHGTATCLQGVCGASCEEGFVASGTNCVSLTSDPGNCGRVGKRCPEVPGYPICCAASTCGAWDGTSCVNVSADPANCGWIGHVCAPAGGKPASCSKGRCARPAGTPRVDQVNGVAPLGQVFRSPFWSGLTLTGANLDLVTWVELEDWGADTVDHTPGGVQSIPTGPMLTLPTGSGGPTIHFQQASATLTVDAASLEFQSAFDPQFQTRHWLKVRIHYTASGRDRSILVDVAVSLSDLVSQGLPPPAITGVAFYEDAWARYDPTTGLLSFVGGAGSLPVPPSSVMSPYRDHELPVLRVAPEGLYLAKGLAAGQVGNDRGDGTVTATIVFPYDPAAAVPLRVPGAGLVLRGSNLWEDGPLQFTDGAGNVVPGEPGALFAGDRIVTTVPPSVDWRSAFVELASMRGTARTPWTLAFIGDPVVSRIESGGQGEDDDDGTGFDYWFASSLSVDEVMTLTGRWLGQIDQMHFEGPPDTWLPGSFPSAPRLVMEELSRIEGDFQGSSFRVVDEHHIEVWIPADHSNSHVLRGEVIYCTCDWCYDYPSINHYGRIVHLRDSRSRVGVSFRMAPAITPDTRVTVCEPAPPDPDWPGPRDITMPDVPGPDLTNTIVEAPSLASPSPALTSEDLP